MSLLLVTWYALACAVDEPMAVFSFRKHPALPLTGFIGGRLGVLQPTFARSYLVIAWRYINGVGMSTGEREQALSYYDDRQQGNNFRGWVKGEDWPERWRERRKSIRNPAAPNYSSVTNGQFAYDRDSHKFVMNCAEDAYRIAVHTLNDRQRQFGSGSTAFRSWLASQDAVFSNCDGVKLSLPPNVSQHAPLLIRQDRSYQTAAALFYAAHYDAALFGFRKIAVDHSSPWSGISNYLVARTLYRMERDEEVKQEATRILASASLASIHGMTWNLMQRAGIHERDQNDFTELARLLSSHGQDNGFREELWNYTDLYSAIIGAADPNGNFWFSEEKGPSDEKRFRSVPITDWIHTFQARDADAHSYAVAQWKRTHSVAWLIAALTHATGVEPEAAAMIRAAREVPDESPAHLTATWQRLRLEAERGQGEKARGELDAILDSSELNDLPSEVNLFRSLRMASAVDILDMMHFALRKPALVVYDNNLGEVPDQESAKQLLDAWKAHEALDRDAVTLLNFDTPFEMMEQAVLSGEYPSKLREEIALAAFTRGLMLGRDLTPTANVLESSTPELTPLIEQWRSATDPDEKRFRAAFLLLRRPEAKPYLKPGISRHSKPGHLNPFRDNWWCPMDILQPIQKRQDESGKVFIRSTIRPAFLIDVSSDAAEEIKALEKQGNAAEFLGRIVLAWAKTHPRDPRIPEALHNVVRVGHFGCSDTNTAGISRSAFQMLWRRYPKSEWAKRTPSWFHEYVIRESLNN